MKRIAMGIAALGLLATAGCSNMNSTEQRTLSGGAIGAGVGAVAGALIPGQSVVGGALIGAAGGAATGYVIDQTK